MSGDTSNQPGLWSVNPPDAHTRAMRLLHQVWPSRCRRGSAFSIEECIDLMARFAEEQVSIARAWEKLAHDAVSCTPLPTVVVRKYLR